MMSRVVEDDEGGIIEVPASGGRANRRITMNLSALLDAPEGWVENPHRLRQIADPVDRIWRVQPYEHPADKVPNRRTLAGAGLIPGPVGPPDQRPAAPAPPRSLPCSQSRGRGRGRDRDLMRGVDRRR